MNRNVKRYFKLILFCKQNKIILYLKLCLIFIFIIGIIKIGYLLSFII